MTVTLELLRHGETTQGGGLRGSLDDDLTDTGWRQMREACAAQGTWDAIISSPLKRCAAFAAELAASRGLPLELADGLRELHFGDWEGCHPRDLMVDQADLLGQFWADPYARPAPGGEHLLAFEERILASCADLAQRYAGQRLLVVTHGGVMRLLLARARQLPRHHLLQVEVGYAQRFVLHRAESGKLTEG